MSREIEVMVEISMNSLYKYEFDEESGELSIDRPLPEPLPYNYGFVPGTLYKDGDPLDVCIIADGPIFPLTKVRVEIIGAFLCDDNGEGDDKIVARVIGEEWDGEEEQFALDEVEHYLVTYKKGFRVLGYVGAEDAAKIVESSRLREQDC